MKQRDIAPASPRTSNLLDAEGFPFDAAVAVDLQPMSQCCDFSKKWNIGNFSDYLQLGHKDRTGAPYWGCPLPFLPVRSVLSTNLLRFGGFFFDPWRALTVT
ncbi:hypothetical protein E0H65_32935 [Rhizobium leguminosarum bv. viciae]|nr:hypothetical protein E0H65_32935 [Rhizobium leguminosarum bv. viciae]